MSDDHKTFTGEDLKHISPTIVDEVKKHGVKYGPGYINLAIPDRGHSPSTVAYDFSNAGELNGFCAEHSNWLLIGLWPRGATLTGIFQELKSEETREELAVIDAAVEEARNKFRKQRAEAQAQEERVKADEEKRDVGLRTIGRMCIELHHPVTEELPLLSKVKSVRKSIADDIVRLFEQSVPNRSNETLKELARLLTKYQKEGA